MRRQAGFTLLEVLLVVVLVATTAMLVVQTLPDDSERDVETAAASLYHKLRLLSDDAMLNGRDYGLRFDDKNDAYTFTFMLSGKEGWQVFDHSKFYNPLTLGENLTYEYQLGGDSWENDDRLFNPGELFDDDRFADLEDEDKVIPPQIYLFSSGEITPVTIYVNERSDSSSTRRWRVLISEVGEISLLSPEDNDPESMTEQ